MAANFPKLPGFVPTHDPTVTSHKRISHTKLEQVSNPKNVDVQLYALPRPPVAPSVPEKVDASKSFSQTAFGNHFNGGKEITEMFEPTFVKLDKQVSARLIRNLGSAFLRILQGKCCREQDRELQNQEPRDLLLP